jgi:chemotaxis signal transduction protein
MAEVHAGQKERAAHLIVRAGRACFGLRTTSIRRLVSSMELHPLAGGGPHVAGLAEFAGEPLLVIDLLGALEAGQSCSRSLVVVVDTGHGAGRESFGMAVDEALEVTVIDRSDVEPRRGTGPMCGHVSVSGRRVAVLDVASLGASPAAERDDEPNPSGEHDAS